MLLLQQPSLMCLMPNGNNGYLYYLTTLQKYNPTREHTNEYASQQLESAIDPACFILFSA